MERIDLGKGRYLIKHTPEEIKQINELTQESQRLALKALSIMEKNKARESKEEASVPHRIIIEKTDGSIEYLEGEDAVNWQKAINDLTELGGIHNREGLDEYKDLQTKWKKGESLQSISSLT